MKAMLKYTNFRLFVPQTLKLGYSGIALETVVVTSMLRVSDPIMTSLHIPVILISGLIR